MFCNLTPVTPDTSRRDLFIRSPAETVQWLAVLIKSGGSMDTARYERRMIRYQKLIPALQTALH